MNILSPCILVPEVENSLKTPLTTMPNLKIIKLLMIGVFLKAEEVSIQQLNLLVRWAGRMMTTMLQDQQASRKMTLVCDCEPLKETSQQTWP